MRFVFEQATTDQLRSRLDPLPLSAELSIGRRGVFPTGYAQLDAALPGGGWPLGDMVEVLQPPAVHMEWRLVMPALIQMQRLGQSNPAGLRRIVLVGAPHLPFAPTLRDQGLSLADMLTVFADDPARRLWACEQALLCPGVGAVLAWLPAVPVSALRRLQYAAASANRLFWMFRLLAQADQPSPAMLRLALESGQDEHGMQVRVLKRRGLPCDRPVNLPTALADWWSLLNAAQWRNRQRHAHAWTVQVTHDSDALLACDSTATTQ